MLEPSPPIGPSLVALRAFEAAARCGSFSRAAEELHVTPAAIAQHVKALEAWAQQPLFDRTARGVTLTQTGLRVRPALTDAFERLSVAAGQLREGSARRGTVRLAALPAVAELWITPRLTELRAALPGLDIAVHAIDRKPDLHRDGFDATAYFEPSSDATDELMAVVAPDLATDLDHPRELATIPRLVDRAWESDWQRWSAPDVPSPTSPVVEFTLFAMAVNAARAGQGALVGRRSLLADFVERGELVEPFERRVATGDHLTIEHREDPRLQPLSDWLETCLG